MKSTRDRCEEDSVISRSLATSDSPIDYIRWPPACQTPRRYRRSRESGRSRRGARASR